MIIAYLKKLTTKGGISCGINGALDYVATNKTDSDSSKGYFRYNVMKKLFKPIVSE